MTERLQRVHAILRDGQVPCALTSAPGGRVVLAAGNDDGGAWDVLLHDTDDELWITDSRGAVQLPHDSTDTTIGDAVKLYVVQAWADQGNPEAKALITYLRGPARNQRSASAWPADYGGSFSAGAAAAQLFDPLQVAGRMFDAASRLGSLFLPPAATVAMTVWSPWGNVQVGFTRR